ncbi:phosphoribosylaminoimidazolesuccinocarboxamide synthase [Salinisphaera sp. USBA-960]|uniref:phosphoribosylaminoimidazolesuccinocarboxamide synthase n=1 Tax=Salinisphaera orenii TaxID=856731 RepID=UPI000DBE4510|nr:phosphoribosylaminoimidazolesuccinocarboxamide synthase [Salifodinibacter halophilus]NNC25584.1 phosphoribosylaminoimidazolesuccinocarboxamide synthase [Salifodinibacter halophilus]
MNTSEPASAAPHAIHQSELASLPLLARGKVRDIYAVDDTRLLIVTSDRLSAYDVVLPNPIPGKGAVLTALTDFWLNEFSDVVRDHRVAETPADVLSAEDHAQVGGRASLVARLEPLPVEAVVRGYLIGSGWRDYSATGRVSGIELPAGLRQADALPEPIFTPSTKAEAGDKDQPMDFAEVQRVIGAERAAEVRDTAIALYRRAAAYASERGIIIADTKFEFGLDPQGRLTLIDEVLTPDSSRFWPRTDYVPGTSPPSFDKQYVRDYLDTLDWDKTAPGPQLPQSVIDGTAARYAEAQKRLTT